jgi:hypothetical protein
MKDAQVDVKSFEQTMRWNINMNLTSARNPAIEPFLEHFVMNGGLKKLIPMLILGYDNIVLDACKCLPVIFEHYCAHDYIKKNPSDLLTIWGKLEDSSSTAIKSQILKTLTNMCSNMKAGSFVMINQAATRYATQIGKPAYVGLVKCLTARNQITWSDTLCFINSMLVRCPSEKKRAQIMARF